MKSTKFKDYLLILLLFVIVILSSIIVNLLFPKSSPNDNTKMEMMNGIPVMMKMELKTFPVTTKETPPTVNLDIVKNKIDGWNVKISTTNFTFTPQKIDTVAVPGEGHVHLYIDDKLYVVFGPWYFIGDLPQGKHIIRAVLANNDHSVYTLNGKFIESSKTIVVK